MRSTTNPVLDTYPRFQPEIGIQETKANQLYQELIASHSGRMIKQRKIRNKRPVRILSAYELNHPRPLMRNPEKITSSSCVEFRNELVKCFQERQALENRLDLMERQLQESENLLAFSRYLLIGHLLEWFQRNCEIKENKLLEAAERVEKCVIELDQHIEAQTLKDYKELYNHFIRLSSSEKICNIFSSTNTGITPATATKLVSKDQVSLRFGKLEILASSFDALKLENVDYGNIFIYPHFMVLLNNRNKVGVVSLSEVEIKYSTQYNLEENAPNDSVIINQSLPSGHKYGNIKNSGKEDRAPKVCLYGVIEIITKTGLHEKYCFSNHNRAAAFAGAFWRYQEKLRM